jgi:hypothetical protein
VIRTAFVPETGIPRALHSSRSSATLRDEKSVEEPGAAAVDLAVVGLADADLVAVDFAAADLVGFAATVVEAFGFGCLRGAMMMQSR